MDKVLRQLDTNKDGKFVFEPPLSIDHVADGSCFFAGIVSKEEFLAAGVDGLPSFVTYPDLGHHYDEESEYFLHHEELYHGTPETQTDESYNHPEGESCARHSVRRR